MSLLLTAALSSVLSAQGATLPNCSWDQPGANAFKGDVVAAVDRYTDIPEAVRTRLKQRISQRQYDEIAEIRRDSITGKAVYSPEIRDMHFAQGTICRTVTRSAWAAHATERGLVYCEADHCLIVPTVCRNLSRVTRLQKPVPQAAVEAPAATAAAGGEPADGKRLALMAETPQTVEPLDVSELQFEAPGAGTSFTQLASVGPVSSLVSARSDSSGSFGGGSGSTVPWLGGTGLPTGGGGTTFQSTPTESPGSVPPIDFPVITPGVDLPDPVLPTTPIPEPGAAVLMLMGLASLAGLRAARQRQKRQRPLPG